MKFYRSGEFKDEVLDKLVEINPKAKSPRFVLDRLNYLLSFIESKKPEYLESFVSHLYEIYKSKITAERQAILQDINEKYENLEKYPELQQASLSYYLQILGLSTSSWDRTVQVANRRYHQAFLHPRYFNLGALIKALGREDAIKLWKQFLTQFIVDHRTPRERPFIDLETMLKERIKPEEEASDWVVIKGMIADGKYAYRNDNCLWVDALDDLPDPEMKYYVCCYGDYEGARNLHESIIMTMEHTIAQGDPYCSRVLHDTRIDYKLEHPPKEFWDKMWPVKKSS